MYWLIALLSVGTIATCVYYLLGGFQEIKVVESYNNTYSVAGKHFTGSMKSDTLRTYFEEVREQLTEKKLRGELCIVNYRDPNLKNTEVHQFIGIRLDDEIAEIPSGFDVIELESTQTFKVALVMHPLVRPNPEKIEGLVHDYAQERGIELQELSMEILFQDNSVLVEMFAQTK